MLMGYVGLVPFRGNTMHWHQCSHCDTLTRCMTEACRNAGYKNCKKHSAPRDIKSSWYDHYDETGHCTFKGTENNWTCLVCKDDGSEPTLEKVLGKERVEAYKQAYNHIHAKSGDLSSYLAEGDSFRAHSLGVSL